MEWTSPLSFGKSYQRVKIHDYSQQKNGQSYVFDPIDERRGYLTGQGNQVRSGDRLILIMDGQATQYEVETIDYYANPCNVWIALVRKLAG